MRQDVWSVYAHGTRKLGNAVMKRDLGWTKAQTSKAHGRSIIFLAERRASPKMMWIMEMGKAWSVDGDATHLWTGYARHYLCHRGQREWVHHRVWVQLVLRARVEVLLLDRLLPLLLRHRANWSGECCLRLHGLKK